ncbi:cell wall-binding repeat-containing protein [Halobacillus salinarum]|uniref:Cell wall-binding repeat-containing protein n=1 Tax=Halobacillus salinarum TaxID=2932257 RepID=A0ABY4EMK3_9BACI|nr:cell wall-binding repeat-containing protein [Halobacillus salinarum]UOQ45684.1 cell wall-binding repeat-containing protein [Halobacillus salinarum]
MKARTKMNQRLLFKLAFLLFFAAGLGSFNGGAEASANNSFRFTEGETNLTLADKLQVNIENNTDSKITVQRNGETLYTHSEALTPIANLFTVEKDNQMYLIVAYRMQGSSQALYFNVLKADSSDVKQIYQSPTYSRAKINIEGNQIQVKEPVYADGAVKSSPQSIQNVTFAMNGEDVKVNKESQPAEKHAITTQSSGGSAPIKVNEKYSNPSYAEISRILTEEAIKADIPPEVVKAIAFQESGWQQYWSKGNTPVSWYTNQDGTLHCENWDGTNLKLGFDCIGIGIMQVSDYRYLQDGDAKDDYVERLKEDIRFNIREGLKILEQKWNYYKIRSSSSNDFPYIPTINNNDRDVIENWYFAVMAYNGLLDRNNPVTNAFSPMAYQEDIFDNIRDYSLVNVSPFPTQKLERVNSRLLNFGLTNVQLKGPLHTSKHVYHKNDTLYVNVNDLNLRKSPGGTIVGKLNAGDRVTVTGTFTGSSSNTSQFVWYPVRTTSGKTGYVAGSYLNKTDKVNSYELSGNRRYETSAAISNYGWHWNKPNAVVLGRGDLPIDSLTGSVLASQNSAPLMLTETNQLPEEVSRELSRIAPRTVYLLGGSKGAVSKAVADRVGELLPSATVKRVAGTNRYETSKAIADEVANHANVNEIFVTTGNEDSPDALSIAPYAGEHNIPILFTESNELSEEVKRFVQSHSISKATIIGGYNPVSSKVQKQLDQLVGSVDRVYGTDRYKTSIAIAKEYYKQDELNNVFFARGDETVDALSGSSLAAEYHAPILLTKTNSLPSVTRSFLNEARLQPTLYYMGGENAINYATRDQIERYANK